MQLLIRMNCLFLSYIYYLWEHVRDFMVKNKEKKKVQLHSAFRERARN